MLLRGTFSWPLFTVFAIFFALFCWEVRKPLRALLSFEKTEGVIQRADYIPPSGSQVHATAIERTGTYTHQAIFTLSDGKTYGVFTRVTSNPPRFQVGDRVSVYYNAENPEDALIGGFLELWFGTLALGFFVLIFFVLWFGSLVGSPSPYVKGVVQGG
ncbi:DUF3592 domain-containing protein [Patescibacteria group bacterium]|nr:DUF3592 domain-containing protein [Patescibacteria group bacterium]MBP9709534.1 DUF3592 domain-containing protein [Patescibacteria group bacterium]